MEAEVSGNTVDMRHEHNATDRTNSDRLRGLHSTRKEHSGRGEEVVGGNMSRRRDELVINNTSSFTSPCFAHKVLRNGHSVRIAAKYFRGPFIREAWCSGEFCTYILS